MYRLRHVGRARSFGALSTVHRPLGTSTCPAIGKFPQLSTLGNRMKASFHNLMDNSIKRWHQLRRPITQEVLMDLRVVTDIPIMQEGCRNWSQRWSNGTRGSSNSPVTQEITGIFFYFEILLKLYSETKCKYRLSSQYDIMFIQTIMPCAWY